MIRSWFVVHAVERRPVADLLREICARANQRPPREVPADLEARTPQCRTCRFNGLAAVAAAQAFEDPQCPHCLKPVVIADLVWTDLVAVPTDDEEAAEVRAAKAKFFDFYASAVAAPMLDTDWEGLIFRGGAQAELEGVEPVELTYVNQEDQVEAYLVEMARLVESRKNGKGGKEQYG
jgi:hypothetical protein